MWLGNRFRVISLLVGDGVLVGLSGVAAIYARFEVEAPLILSAPQGWWTLGLLVMAALSSNYFFDLYDLRTVSRHARQAFGTVLSVGPSIAFTGLLLALMSYAAPQMRLGRGVFGLSLGLLMMAMLAWRQSAGWLLGRKELSERVLILGTDPNAVEVARETLKRRENGFEVVGFIGTDPALVGRSLINPCVLGVTADMTEVVRQRRVNRIVVASDESLPLDRLLGLKLTKQLAVEDAPAFYERLTGKVEIEHLSLRHMLFAQSSWSARLYSRARRLVSIVLAAVGLVLSAPLMLLAIVAIKLDSPGPAFYVQERIGQFGKIFKILKLRTMREGAEPHGAVWAAKADARVTKVGRFLRKSRIDELPQFINVLRGDMSFIGPRPERPAFVELLEKEIPYFSQRHLVRPGLTGWAQVRASYCASIEEAKERHQYDLYYIKNQSPMLDALILLETVRVVCRGKLGR